MPSLAHQIGLTALLLLPHAQVQAQTRLLRQFAEERGLVPPVWAIGQDRSGFLWIGAQGGLLRYDGTSMDRWDTGSHPAGIISLDFHSDGRIAAVSELGDVFEVRGGAAHDLHAPGEPGPRMLRMVAYDADGGLWTIRGRDVWRRTVDGLWRHVQWRDSSAERPLMLRRDAGRAMLVSTNLGVWRVANGETARKIVESDGIADLLAMDDRVVVLRGSGEVFTWRRHDGSLDTLSIPEIATAVRSARPIALARRANTLWVAFDRFLVGVRDDGSVGILSSEDGIDGGGPLFVDREGSLWMGTFSALMQFPEPDTRIWSESEGLPSRHVRFLARAGSDIWVSSWQGLGRIQSAPTAMSASTVSDWFTQERLCLAPDRGAVWGSSRRGYIEISSAGAIRLHTASGLVLGCAPARAGGLWIASTAGLLHVPAGGDSPRPFRQPQQETTPLWEAVLEDRSGRLWLAREGRICASQLPPAAQWRCGQLGETGKVTGITELASGAIWVSTMKTGVLAQRADGEWETLRSSRELPTGAIFGLIPSTSGGVWVVGHGVAQRVVESADGWSVVERLGPWNGLPAVGGSDLLEDADGRIWIATAFGVVEIPPTARFTTATPPAVALVEATVDGIPLDASRAFELPYDQNRLELRFAALSFRDPGRVRYQVRLPADGRWQNTRGSPSFRWSDLQPGQHAVQFRASLDGREWSASPASVQFSVRPPWYRQPWAISLFLLLLGTTALAIHRARVRMLLGLERQRTRIAMDLHDEIGSGLGSIGILAGVLSNSVARSAEVPVRERNLANEIAQTSEQLGEALSDIVWALDPKTASLCELALRLTEHGHRLCFASDGPEFVAELPEQWPAGDLSTPVRRNVLAIGFEALHNAVRHAQAGHVALRLHPAGTRWEMSIEDDGSGLPAKAAAGADADAHAARRTGHGLPGMRHRAMEIGADLAVHSDNGGGTRVRLRFQLS